MKKKIFLATVSFLLISCAFAQKEAKLVTTWKFDSSTNENQSISYWYTSSNLAVIKMTMENDIVTSFEISHFNSKGESVTSQITQIPLEETVRLKCLDVNDKMIVTAFSSAVKDKHKVVVYKVVKGAIEEYSHLDIENAGLPSPYICGNSIIVIYDDSLLNKKVTKKYDFKFSKCSMSYQSDTWVVPTGTGLKDNYWSTNDYGSVKDQEYTTIKVYKF